MILYDFLLCESNHWYSLHVNLLLQHYVCHYSVCSWFVVCKGFFIVVKCVLFGVIFGGTFYLFIYLQIYLEHARRVD